jgi:hypothetical protein
VDLPSWPVGRGRVPGVDLESVAVRNVFFALIFVNLAYFAWAHWVDTPHPPPVNENIQKLPRLKLASEAPSAAAAGSAERTAFTESASCMSVGPFGDLDNSSRAALVLKSRGFESRQRAEAGEPATIYEVRVEPLKADLDASRTVKELQRLGFKDAIAIPASTEAALHVSVGTFNERARAQQRLMAAKLKGFKTEVTAGSRPVTFYWIDLAPPPGVSSVPLQDLFAEGINSKLAVRPCPGSAPAKTLSAKELGSVRQARTAAVSKLP